MPCLTEGAIQYKPLKALPRSPYIEFPLFAVFFDDGKDDDEEGNEADDKNPSVNFVFGLDKDEEPPLDGHHKKSRSEQNEKAISGFAPEFEERKCQQPEKTSSLRRK